MVCCREHSRARRYKEEDGEYRRYIDSYRESIRNLGTSGIDIICYNFMPVLDWSRTHLQVVFRDGSITTGLNPGYSPHLICSS